MKPGDLIYESGPVKVGFAGSEEEYDLFFGDDARVHLDRGILEELAETVDPIRLGESLERIGGYSVASAVRETPEWSMARLGWVLSQTYASEVKRKRDYFIGERDYYKGELRQAAR